MIAGVRRRVRVTVEADAHEVSGKCGLLRLDMPADATGLSPVVMVNPSWPGVTVEDLAPSYNWQDGDVILSVLGNVFVRDAGRWYSTGHSVRWTDGMVSAEIRDGGTVLRYQVGEL